MLCQHGRLECWECARNYALKEIKPTKIDSRLVAAHERIEDLERQLAERDADSARYRWLRAQNELLQDDAFVVLSKDSPLCSCCESSWVGADLDSAIDKELGK